MNVIRNNEKIGCALLKFQLARLHSRTDVDEADVISESLDRAYFFWCWHVSTIRSIESV